MSARYFRLCDYCGAEVECSPDYPTDARVLCAECMLAQPDTRGNGHPRK